MTELNLIVCGHDADRVEVRAAEVLADRARLRLAQPVRAAGEDQVTDPPVVVLGTPESCRLVDSAVSSGRLDLPAQLGSEGFVLDVPADAPAMVAARTSQGLVYGVGRLLRESRFLGGRWVLPHGSVSSVPDKQVRPIYFATHFGNWYCHVTVDDLRRYIEDLALWGYNALVTWFDFHHYHYRDLDDGAEDWDRLAQFDALAREIGMRVGRVAIANESFAGQAPPELRATGRLEGTGYETDLCPSRPEARAIILQDRRAFLERVQATTSLDWLCLWPYDQGGCNCDRCSPWPTTYMELCREIAELTAEILPETETMVSAWWIGAHRPGEDEAFFNWLEKRERWFRTVVVGTPELRRWLADGRKVPEEYGLLLFPEISMFDALPWGSRAANPAPRKFAAELAELGPYIAGAMPYSEGRYEDINKVLWAQLQWDATRDVGSILQDYCRYSFGPDTAEDGAQLLFAIEAGLKDLPSAPSHHEDALRLETRMEEWGRRGWRWEMVRTHTAIDALKWEVDAPDTPEERRAQARTELRTVYEHLQHELSLHHPERTLRNWLYLPFDIWVTLPFNELVLPTGT